MTDKQETVLVCDDDADIAAAIAIYLRAEGYLVLCASNGQEALTLCRKEHISLLILDIMMPVTDGITALTTLRGDPDPALRALPVILLTAKGEEADKVLGLNLGADDYISKPFHPAELMARVRSQLRRYLYLGSRVSMPQILRCGGLELDPDSRCVRVDGDEVSVTPTEFTILKLLMSEPDTVFSTKEICLRALRIGASTDTFGAENNVAVHIRHLREKIEIDPANPRYLKVVWGRGYKIESQGDL
ncbi:MAG: response regulator transcription factor [Clostridia bacterium]|nr:response regulator transcription factor [Clostridia bacterium]